MAVRRGRGWYLDLGSTGRTDAAGSDEGRAAASRSLQHYRCTARRTATMASAKAVGSWVCRSISAASSVCGSWSCTPVAGQYHEFVGWDFDLVDRGHDRGRQCRSHPVVVLGSEFDARPVDPELLTDGVVGTVTAQLGTVPAVGGQSPTQAATVASPGSATASTASGSASGHHRGRRSARPADSSPASPPRCAPI